MTRGWTGGRRAGLLLMVTVVLAGAGRRGEMGTVTTQDGQTFDGDVSEKGGLVIVMMKGNIPVKIQKANVASIEYAGSVKEQFEQKLAKLAKEDAAGRVALAESALNKQEYDLTLDALDGAIAIDPNYEAALRMRRDVQKRRSMQRNQAATKPKAKAGAEAAPAATDEPPMDAAAADDQSRPAAARQRAAKGTEDVDEGAPIRLVTPREINRIRQLEMRKGEQVRVSFQNQVKQRYLASSDLTPQEFNKLTPVEQAWEILQHGSSNMRPDVTIATDPATLAQFKQNVQRHILPGCASAACHSSANKAVKFTLHNPATKEPEAFTNFLLLQKFKTTEGGKDRAMIDRTRPEDSLLLQMGLPPRDSPSPHPEVQNFRPLFKGKNDRNYQGILSWMEDSLEPVAPEYGIDLSKPPEEDDSTTRPTRRGGAAK